MFPIEAFERTARKFVFIATKLNLPFHFTGGVVSSAYGEPRMTQDFDIVVSPVVAKTQVDELCKQLSGSDFLYTEAVVRKAILNECQFQLLDKTETLKLDIYPRELIPGELGRSQQIELFPGVFLPIVSRYDAALSKLIWIEKGSHRSRRDLRSIFRNGDMVQQDAIRTQSQVLGLGVLLDEVLNESDEYR